MLQVSAWVRTLVAVILIGGLLLAMPNALPENVRGKLPGWLQNTVSLGLDLQGGSYVLLEVELDQVIKDQLDSTLGDLRRGLRKEHIGYRGISAAGDSVSVTVIDPRQFDDALSTVKDLNPRVGGAVLAVGQRQYEITQPGGSQIVMRMTQAYKTQLQNDVVNRSIEVVRKRIDELGTKEPAIEQQGKDRIVVQVPGLSDPTRLLRILQTTAKMTFQMVDETGDIAAAMRGSVPIGDELLQHEKGRDNRPQIPVLVEKRVRIAGDRLKAANWENDPQTGQVVVAFRFDGVGAREFADITKNSVGHRFAVVLDKKVLTDPVIQVPILGGSGIIQGNFTVETANDLAILMRAGALPAPLKPIEQRVVGPQLGKDSVEAGRYAALAGLAMVALFMVLRYGLFGLFADVALVFNVILLLAALTLFGATLTLPGIAGIVLTMGMAVDANVLIFERMREEHRNGRSMLGSIDTGESRAIATIVDANMTHLIAALILFELGSGPVRGFAVTLGVGIITSFFTAVMVTRLIVIGWLQVAKPKKLII